MTVSTNNMINSGNVENESWLQKHWQKLVALLLWVGLVGAYFAYATANNLGPLEAVQELLAVMQDPIYGPLIYIGLYAIRPLIFFSAAILTLAGGFLFGPIYGVIYTVVAANISAMVAYFIGRYFGQGLLDLDGDGDTGDESIIQRYAQRMRDNSFETIFVMRLVYLPYDLVNYLAGFLRIDWRAFILATMLGSLAGTVSFVLFGASIESFDGTLPEFDPRVLAISVILFVGGLLVSRYMKRREGSTES